MMRFNRSPSPSPSRRAAVLGKRESAAPTPRSNNASGAAVNKQVTETITTIAGTPIAQERRRSFAFMKYSSDRRSSKSMNRTREHARKIAMQLSQEASTFNPTFPDDGADDFFQVQQQQQQQQPIQQHRHPPQQQHQQQQQQRHQPPQHHQPQQYLPQQQQTPHRRTVAPLPLPSPSQNNLDLTPSNKSVSSQNSLSRMAAPATPGRLPLPRSERPSAKKSLGLSQFVEQQQQQYQRRCSTPSAPAIPLNNNRNSSMPTFPSNSSMQTSFVQPKIDSTQSISTASHASGSAGAAARRRVRNRMNGKSNSSNAGSQHTTIDEDDMIDSATPPRFFYEPLEETPPHSPAHRSSSSVGSVGSRNSRRRSGALSSPNPAIAVSAVAHQIKSTVSSNSSGGGNGSGRPPLLPGMAASSPSNGSSNSSADFFLVETVNPGFTFDAFGLDAHEVDNEVNAAMQELAGGHPDWSVMFSSDEFPLQQWDSSSQPNSEDHNHSAPSSPIPTAEDNDDGFVDGFRIAPPRPMMMMPSLPIHIRQSPTNSERSSLTSNSAVEGGGRVNVFKEQAGFHSSKAKRVVRSSPPTLPPQQPPLVDDDDDDFDDPFPVTPTSWPASTALDKMRDKIARLSDSAPNIPSLGETTATITSDEVTTTQEEAVIQVRVESEAGAPSEAGLYSDEGFLIPSDAGVSSDVVIGKNHHHLLDDYYQQHHRNVPEELSIGPKRKSKSPPKEKIDYDDNAGDDAIGNMAAFIPGEEKKEDEEDNESFRDLSKKGAAVGNLKAALKKWERQPTESSYQKPASTSTPSTPHRRPFTSISPRYGDKKTLKQEVPTPKSQQQEQEQQQQQQTPLSNYRNRLRPVEQANRPMSDAGVASSPSPAHAYLSKMRAAGAASATSQVYGSETKSDVGGSSRSPRFLADAKLRRTGVLAKFETKQDQLDNNDPTEQLPPPPPPMSSPDSFSANRKRFQEQQQDQDLNTSSGQQSPLPRRLTYRERRELELRREREERAKAEMEEQQKTSSEKDVASLIRRRIAANRRAGASPSASGNNGSLMEKKESKSPVSYRDKLKPVSTPTAKDIKSVDSSYLRSNDEESRLGSFRSALSTESSTIVDTPNHQSLDEKDYSVYQTPRRSPFEQQQLENSKSNNDVLQSAPSRISSGRYHNDDNDDHNDVYSKPQHQLETARQTPTTNSSYTTPRREHDRDEPVVPLTSAEPRDNSRFQQQMQQSGNDHERRSDNTMYSPSLSQSKSMSHGAETPPTVATSSMSSEPKSVRSEIGGAVQADSAKAMLNAFLAKRLGPPNLAVPPSRSEPEQRHEPESKLPFPVPLHPPSLSERPKDGPPALKDDPKYDRYFRMLKVGMPMDVVKHAMTRDGMDPTVMDGDPNMPAGYGKNIPLKEDPRFFKYFKMLKLGMSVETVKHAMECDGMDPTILDQDPNQPLNASKKAEEVAPKEKDTHRRARLHWQTLRQVRSNSLWAKIDKDPEVQEIEIDEEEFAELFQKEILSPTASGKSTGSPRKRSVGVRVIDTKRANNGGIILARLKMTHDDLADAVDRIDEDSMTAEQIQNVIEYLPSREERKALEAYMLEGGQDAAEKFDGLCECEKFMVSMMTVQHAKRKVKALLFKLQFQSCLESLQKDAQLVEVACDELSNSVRLRKLLGIVLTIGNRLNTAGVSTKRKAGAFTLESLLKLNQAKAFDKKTTFLQYVVLVVQRNNELLLRFKDDLPTVLKADRVYWDQVLTDLEEVENQLENVRQMSLHQARQAQMYQLKKKKQNEEDGTESLSDFSMSLEEEVETLRATAIGLFTLGAIKQVSALREKVEATKRKFAKLLEYFGEEDKALQPHEVFNIIVTFCREFDKAREHVFSSEQRKMREQRKKQNNGNREAQSNAAKRPPMSQPSPNKRENLRLSSHQPNIGALMKDIQRQPTKQPVDETTKNPPPPQSSSSNPWAAHPQPDRVQAHPQPDRVQAHSQPDRVQAHPQPDLVQAHPQPDRVQAPQVQPVAGTRPNVDSWRSQPPVNVQLKEATPRSDTDQWRSRPPASANPTISTSGKISPVKVAAGKPVVTRMSVPEPVVRPNDHSTPSSSGRGHIDLLSSSSFPDVDINSTTSRGQQTIKASTSLPDVDIPPGMQEQGHLEPVPSDVSSSALSPSPSWSESVKADMSSLDKASQLAQQKARWRRQQQRLRPGRGSVSSSSSTANQSTLSGSQQLTGTNNRSASPAKSDTYLLAPNSRHTQQHQVSSSTSQPSPHKQQSASSNHLELSPRSSIRQKRRNAQRAMKVAQS